MDHGVVSILARPAHCQEGITLAKTKEILGIQTSGPKLKIEYLFVSNNLLSSDNDCLFLVLGRSTSTYCTMFNVM